MQAKQVIQEISATGGKVFLVDGKLKGKNLTRATRELVKGHKLEILQFLQQAPC